MKRGEVRLDRRPRWWPWWVAMSIVGLLVFGLRWSAGPAPADPPVAVAARAVPRSVPVSPPVAMPSLDPRPADDATDEAACRDAVPGSGAVEAPGAAARRDALADAARRRSIELLRDRPDDLARAVALLLGFDDDARNRLAHLASATEDARVYALAFHTCRGRNDGNCQLLSAAQWARLAPANAVPWLYVASDAEREHDAAGFRQALQRAAQASTSDMGEGIALPMLPSLPGEPIDATAGRAVLASQLTGVIAAWPGPALPSVVAFCRAVDAGQVEICQGLAEVLATRSTSLIDRQVGIRLGARVGWPTERIERMTAEVKLLWDAMSAEIAEALHEPGCRAVERSLEGMQRRATLGDEAAARDRVARSGVDWNREVDKQIAVARAAADRRRTQAAEPAN